MKKIVALSLSVLFLAACSTSNNVASNKLFQKRKYKKGWHVNSTKKFDKSVQETQEEVATVIESSEVLEQKTTETVVSNKPVNNAVNENLGTEVQENSQVETATTTQPSLDYADLNDISGSEDVFVSNENVATEEFVRANDVSTKKIEENSSNSNSDTDVGFVLLLILCFIIPPITVGILRGWTSREFLINLILYLLAVGFVPFLIGGAYIAGALAVIHALLILFDIL